MCARVTWKTAVVVSDANWAPAVLERGLYLVGDHNLCGLEDSYITGLCAANQIADRALTRPPAPPRRGCGRP